MDLREATVCKTPEALAERFSLEQLENLARQYTDFLHHDRKENALLYYVPVSPQARAFHLATEKTRGLFGGNRSAKTETMITDMLIMATKIIPFSLRGSYPKEKLRCPAVYRLTIESLTTTLHQTILPKLQYWYWTGIDDPGGSRGHWGWVPRAYLIASDWEKAWSEKLKMLKLRCGCVFQFFSHEQDPSDFASGSVYCAGHDELPKKAIWRENRARVMDMGGQMLLAMTPPDEAGIPVDWVYDEIYEQGMDGPLRDPHVRCWNLFTEQNPHLDQAEVMHRASQMTAEEREVRLHGRFLHLSNLIHPLFTDTTHWWCFGCNRRLIAVHGDLCPFCSSKDISEYSHVAPDEEFDDHHGFPLWTRWPIVYLVDPHDRRPHAMAWIAVAPNDDGLQIGELELDAEVTEVAKEVLRFEQQEKMFVASRIMDPNMGESPSGKRRGLTWKQEFAEAGLSCSTRVDDSFSVGKSRVNEMLRPDARTRRPRFRVLARCQRSMYQAKRFTWAEWARYTTGEREAKEKPRDKHSDFPALWRYFANMGFTFRMLRSGGEIIKTRVR